MLISSALVFLMVPGVGLFNSGVSGRRSAISMVWLPVFTAALIGLEVSQARGQVAFGSDALRTVVPMGLRHRFRAFVEYVLGQYSRHDAQQCTCNTIREYLRTKDS